MSKIAELLKLEAQKKAENLRVEIVESPSNNDSVSKSKGDEVGVSKRNHSEVSVTKSNGVEVSVSKSDKTETSPSKNFTKTPNSTVKRAIPEKFFRGLSKHTYDVLWLQTRGSITPKRTVQLTKEDLVRMTGLSKDAVKLHIKYLKESGLIKSYPAIGSRAGWEYEVLIIEEIEDGVSVSKGKEVGRSKWDENLHLPSDENLHLLTHTHPYDNKGVNLFSKTSLKTNTKNDDESAGASAPFALLNARLDAAVRKMTGKPASAVEAEKWGSLAELLILEMEAAATRTEMISSVPAFLTEVLRRKLLQGNAPPVNKTLKAKPDTVGRPNAEGEYEKKPLDAAGREAAFLELKDFAEEDFLPDFEKWYTPADWRWLSSELEKLRADE